VEVSATVALATSASAIHHGPGRRALADPDHDLRAATPPKGDGNFAVSWCLLGFAEGAWRVRT